MKALVDVGRHCKNTSVRSVFWQVTDNLILVYTGKSRCKGKNKFGAKQTYVKIITMQITVCVKVLGELPHFSGHQKFEDRILILLEGLEKICVS